MVPVSARLATKRIFMFSTSRALLLAASLLAAWPMSAQAQNFQSGPVPDTFGDQSTSGVVLLGRKNGLLGPYADTGYFGPYLTLQHIAGDGPGYRDNGFTSVGLFAPKKFFGGILFGEGRLAVNDFGNLIGNVGGGYRYYSADHNRTYGVSAWYDVDAGHRSTFSQGGVGLETRGEGWDAFVNGYYPLDDDDKLFNTITTPTGATAFGFTGRNLLVNRPNLITRQFEFAMMGFDAEIGGPLPMVGKYGIRGYGGYYHYEHDSLTDVNGGRFRLQAEFTDSLTGQFLLTNDNQFDTSVIFSIAWTLPGNGASRGEFSRPSYQRSGRTVVRAQSPDNRKSVRQYYRMFQPTQRSNRVFVTVHNTQTMEDSFTVLTDPTTGQPIVFLHLDSRAAAGGDGTFENPFATPQEAQAGTGVGDTIYAHAGSIFNTPANNFIALQQNQQLLGEGVEHLINTDELGLIPIPASGDAGGLPTFQGAGGPAAITLANASRVSGFNINDSVNAGLLADANLTVGNTTTVENTTINRGPIGLNVMNAAGTVNFAATSSINGTTMAGLNVAGATTGTVNVNGTIANAAGRSFAVDMLQAGGAVNIIGQVTATGGTGSLIQNSAGNVTVTNASLMNIDAGSTGLLLDNNPNATIRFGQIDIMTNNGSAFVGRDSGTLIVTGGTLTANGGPALFLDLDGTMNPFNVNARFNDVTSNMSNNALSMAGIHINGVSGPVSVSGTATINAPMGRGLEFIDSSANVNIATLNINDSMGNAVFLDDTSGVMADRLTGSLIVDAGLLQRTAAGNDTFLINAGSPTVQFGANINHGVAVVNNNAMVNVTNTNIGTSVFSGTLVANDGTGLQFTDAGSTVNFTGTTTLNGGDAGIDILAGAGGGSTGSFTFGTNTTITNPTGVAFNVNNNNMAAQSVYAGTITQQNAVRVVDVNNFGTGGQLTFSGANVTAQGMSTGVIVQNSGGNVMFNNLDMDNVGGGGNGDLTQLTLTTNTGTSTFDTLNVTTAGTQAILANNGGTFSAGASGDSNVITTGVTAIQLMNNTAVGNVRFQTVSATATAGTDGIILSNVGGGGLFVIDDGNALTANDLTVANTGNGNGVNINGANTNSTFTFAATDIDNLGNGNGIDINGITGTANFARTNINGAAIGVNLTNIVGNVTFNDNTFTTSDDLVITSTTGTGIDINNTGNMAMLTFAATDLSNTGTTAGAAVDINGGGGMITFGDGNVNSLDDLDITNTNGGIGINITGTNNMANYSFETVEIDNTAGGVAVDINGTDGMIAFGDGSNLTTEDLNIFNTTSGVGIDINGTMATSMLSFQTVDITNTGGASGVNVLNAAGMITFDDGDATTISDLAISNTGGANGFQATTSAATFNVVSIDVRDVGAAFDGINLNALTGVFNAGTTTVTNATGGAFANGININGGTGTYNFATGAGQSTNVTGSTLNGINVSATLAAVTFGTSNINMATVNGVNINATIGTVTFGQTNVNGAVNGINITNNVTALTSFAGGGMIRAFTGNGINATGAGAGHVFRNFNIALTGINNNDVGINFANATTMSLNPLTIGSNTITMTLANNSTGIVINADGAAAVVTLAASNGAANNNVVTIIGGAGNMTFTETETNGGVFAGAIRINGADITP